MLIGRADEHTSKVENVDIRIDHRSGIVDYLLKIAFLTERIVDTAVSRILKIYIDKESRRARRICHGLVLDIIAVGSNTRGYGEKYCGDARNEYYRKGREIFRENTLEHQKFRLSSVYTVLFYHILMNNTRIKFKFSRKRSGLPSVNPVPVFSFDA
jgi:hypothetical protein